MMSAMLRRDCLVGYLAMSHWKRVKYDGKSPVGVQEFREKGNQKGRRSDHITVQKRINTRQGAFLTGVAAILEIKWKNDNTW